MAGTHIKFSYSEQEYCHKGTTPCIKLIHLILVLILVQKAEYCMYKSIYI